MKTTKKLKRMVAGVLASLMAMSGTANVWAADTEENIHLSTNHESLSQPIMKIGY